MDNFKICKAENGEMIDRCLKIRNAVFILERGVPGEIEVDEHDCIGESCDHFLILWQGSDAGTVRCLHQSGNTVKIQRFCFLKEYRGRGLGKEVIEYIEDFYKKRNVTTIEMDAKYDVSGFYEKCGYRKVSDVFIEAGIEHIKMMKNL